MAGRSSFQEHSQIGNKNGFFFLLLFFSFHYANYVLHVIERGSTINYMARVCVRSEYARVLSRLIFTRVIYLELNVILQRKEEKVSILFL